MPGGAHTQGSVRIDTSAVEDAPENDIDPTAADQDSEIQAADAYLKFEGAS
jgi:hypothetical protein